MLAHHIADKLYIDTTLLLLWYSGLSNKDTPSAKQFCPLNRLERCSLVRRSCRITCIHSTWCQEFVSFLGGGRSSLELSFKRGTTVCALNRKFKIFSEFCLQSFRKKCQKPAKWGMAILQDWYPTRNFNLIAAVRNYQIWCGKSQKNEIFCHWGNFPFSECSISISECGISNSWAQNVHFLSAEIWVVCLYLHFTGRHFHCDGKIGPDGREAWWISVRTGYEWHERSRSASKHHEWLPAALLLTLLKTSAKPHFILFLEKRHDRQRSAGQWNGSIRVLSIYSSFWVQNLHFLVAEFLFLSTEVLLF